MEPLEDLEANIRQALERRMGIKHARDSARLAEQNIRSALDAIRPETAEAPLITHPLQSRAGISSELGSLVEAIHAEVEKMVSIGAEIRTFGRQLNQCLAETRALREKKKRLTKVGWWIVGGSAAIALTLSSWAWLALPVGILCLRSAPSGRAVEGAVGKETGLRESIAAAESRLEACRHDARGKLEQIAQVSTRFFRRQLVDDANEWARAAAGLPPILTGDWTEETWRAHDFRKSYRLPYFYVGAATEHPQEGDVGYRLPVLIPFLGRQHCYRFDGAAETTLSLMQALIVQLAATMPYGATITLLDPSGAGRAFPMQRQLPYVRPVGADAFRDLESILDEITRIIHTYLDDETHSFDQLPEQIQANERYEFIFAANFPENYDRRTIEALQSIARNGPVAGKYLFLQSSDRKGLPNDLSWNDFENLRIIDTKGQQASANQFEYTALRCPEAGAQSMVLRLLADAKPPETKIAWEDLCEQLPGNWWKHSAESMVSAPVGASGRERKLTIWFGSNREGRPCAHGVLGAMTGSGKSNMYHVLICGLATRYSPDELNLYLIDGKVGVEFQSYRKLPHARVVALHSSPDLSRSVLAELLTEMKLRNEIFKSRDVADLPGYRALGDGAPMPRVILMIDEYQELFENDREGKASAALLQLAQQGRSAGIHMLLGSQRFGAVGMLNQAAIFGNIHLRIAMKMSQSDVQGLTEFGRNGRRLIEQCDLPGKIVINDQSGEDRSNEFGKVALLEPEARAEVIGALSEKAAEEWPTERKFATVVFDGQEQPNLSENPQVVDVLRRPARPSPDEWREIAAAPMKEAGFAIVDWFEGERPIALWLGQEPSVYGQAIVPLRRRLSENVLLVGDNQSAATGMLAAMLCAVAVHERPDGIKLRVLDRSVPGTPWQSTLTTVVDELLKPLQYDVALQAESATAARWLDDYCREIDRRSGIEEDLLASQPTWILMISGADRVPQIVKTQSKFGTSVDSTEGEKLARICRDGPALGVHLILSFPGAGPMMHCLSRDQLDRFKHRIATQMSESDSFLLLGKDGASKLQKDGPSPVLAAFQDAVVSRTQVFKPYVSGAQIPWSEQAQFLREQLTRWQ